MLIHSYPCIALFTLFTIALVAEEANHVKEIALGTAAAASIRAIAYFAHKPPRFFAGPRKKTSGVPSAHPPKVN